MAKKNRIYDFDDDEELVLDKKTKRRLERAKLRESQQQAQVVPAEEEETKPDPVTDAMSRIALLCQEKRWREAVLFCRQTMVEAETSGNEDVLIPMSMALGKLEMSLRRQMASAFIVKVRTMLKKEYLLDVGE